MRSRATYSTVRERARRYPTALQQSQRPMQPLSDSCTRAYGAIAPRVSCLEQHAANWALPLLIHQREQSL